MKKNNPTKSLSIRFRRWTRKAYAMFGSIGRNVTIGCLSKDIIEASLNKQKGNQTLSLWMMEELNPNLKEEDNPLPDIVHQTILLQPLVLNSKDYCPVQSVNIKGLYNNEKGRMDTIDVFIRSFCFFNNSTYAE